MAASDFAIRRLPDRVVLPAAAATLLCVFGQAGLQRSWRPLTLAAASGAAVFVSLWLLWRFSRSALGYGDTKLGLLLGLALGCTGWFAPFLTLLLGNIAAALTMLICRRKDFPLGPLLIAAALDSCFTASMYGPTRSKKGV